MKILFLDIDGVLNSKKTLQRHEGMIGIDPYLALLVDRIQQATGCKIVLSSTWRIWASSRKEVRRFVDFMDVTDQKSSRIRGEEIKQWLDAYPEVTRYAIVDDDSDMLDEQKPNFFQTSFETGLTEEIAKSITNHLLTCRKTFTNL